MQFELPKEGARALIPPHFPTVHQAFIFRAQEYVPYKRIADILETTEDNVKRACTDMGLTLHDIDGRWVEKGYITIIKQMWHILPYSQLLRLIDMDEATFAMTLREEDFLDIKLKLKPKCDKVVWRELTDSERARTAEIKELMQTVDMGGVMPFDFKYDVPDIRFSGKEYFKTRYIYAFSGLYLHAFDVDSRSYLPDEQLEAYRRLGINGLWTQAVLYQLTELPFAPELSRGFERRLQRLKDIVARCKRYGIKLYLYINEPRSMPLEFEKKYPSLAGHRHSADVSMCTSTKEVQDYLKNNIEWLCRQVPDLGGFFTITRSENHTNCYSHATPETCTCNRCKNRSVGEVIGELIGCIEEGAHRVSPDIKVIAWDWAWSDSNFDIIEHLPDNVTLMCKSEQDVPFVFGGVQNKIRDYSITKIGPGDNAKREWAVAKRRGLTLGAKVQINTSWECSTVPAVPTYPLIEKHMKALRDEGATDIMLSWTLGGYPSLCLAHAAKYFYESCDMPELNDTQRRACEILCEALYEFPSELHVQYYGAHNGGPSNPLYSEPTGYRATMTCFAYDDLDGWRYNYPEDVFELQHQKICDGLERAVELLKNEPECETVIMAQATYYIYRSTLNQIQFVRARGRGDKAQMKRLAASEAEMARGLLTLMNKNAAIGFEAANHYYYSKGQLAEKILNCQYIIDKYNEVGER